MPFAAKDGWVLRAVMCGWPGQNWLDMWLGMGEVHAADL